jgi:hypothetical protein
VRQKSRNVIAVTFTVALLAAAGCHSSSSPGAEDNPVVGSTQTTSAPQAATTSTRSAPGAPASASAPASSGSGAASSAAATSGGAAPSSSAKAPGKPSGFARAGRYTYTVSGTSTQPLSGTKPVSGTQTDVYDPPRGSTQHSRTSDAQGSTDQTLSAQRTGLYLQDLHIAMQGFDEDFRPDGTALFFPANYRAGSHWTWRARSSDGKYTLAAASKIASVSHGNVVLDTSIHISGSGFDINAQQRDWVSTTYALILKEHAVTKGTAYGANVSSDITRTLQSTTPS